MLSQLAGAKWLMSTARMWRERPLACREPPVIKYGHRISISRMRYYRQAFIITGRQARQAFRATCRNIYHYIALKPYDAKRLKCPVIILACDINEVIE